MRTTYNGFQSIQVIATSQFVPYVSYVDQPARVILYVALDGEDMEVTVNADRSCSHDGSKEGYFPFHARQKGAVVVDGHQRALDIAPIAANGRDDMVYLASSLPHNT